MPEEREGYIFVDAMADAESNPSGGITLFTPLIGLSDVEADHYLARRCVEHMTAKLALSRANGRGGWHTPECSDEHLHKMLREHVEKGDMVDVLNIVGMILVRQESRARQEPIPMPGPAGCDMPMLGPTGDPGTKAEKIRSMFESHNWTTQAGCVNGVRED